MNVTLQISVKDMLNLSNEGADDTMLIKHCSADVLERESKKNM